jgi:hypothetical protein
MSDAKGRAIDKINPGTHWVFEGEGTPYEKLDGLTCKYQKGIFYKQTTLKAYRHALAFALNTPRWQWEPLHFGELPIGWIADDVPKDKIWRGWIPDTYPPIIPPDQILPDGIYEIIGPKYAGNPYGLNSHFLISHGSNYSNVIFDFELTYKGIKAFLYDHQIAGIFWENKNGDNAQITRLDFKFRWGAN